MLALSVRNASLSGGRARRRRLGRGMSTGPVAESLDRGHLMRHESESRRGSRPQAQARAMIVDVYDSPSHAFHHFDRLLWWRAPRSGIRRAAASPRPRRLTGGQFQWLPLIR